VPVGPAVDSAMHETRREPGKVDASALEALIEAGAAAVTAGASDAGVQSLRTAARLADHRRPPALRVRARLVLAEALIHVLRGLDEEGLAALSEADEIARAHHLTDAVADARCELGYVDYLRARYERARLWLTDALAYAGSSPGVAAEAMTYLGAVDSDRAEYPAAVAGLERAVELSRAAGDPRREAFGLSMLGRIHLLRGEVDAAADRLDAAAHAPGAVAQRTAAGQVLPTPRPSRHGGP
jgi:tetratricopeptide (TPR) repeat protein